MEFIEKEEREREVGNPENAALSPLPLSFSLLSCFLSGRHAHDWKEDQQKRKQIKAACGESNVKISKSQVLSSSLLRPPQAFHVFLLS
jgi:hypothetical protein